MKTILTSIDINATAEQVWSLLTDFASHPNWNPFIRRISGELRVGGKLAIAIAPPGGKGMSFEPRLLVVEPDRELRWQGKLFLPGIFDGQHFFKLTPIGDRTRLEHGEHFGGLLVALMGSSWLEQTRQGFEMMNEALREEAEKRAGKENEPARQFSSGLEIQ